MNEGFPNFDDMWERIEDGRVVRMVRDGRLLCGMAAIDFAASVFCTPSYEEVQALRQMAEARRLLVVNRIRWTLALLFLGWWIVALALGWVS